MTPAEKLIAIVEAAKPDISDGLYGDREEWKAARALLAELLANYRLDAQPRKRCPNCRGIGRDEMAGVIWCKSCGWNLTREEATKQGAAQAGD
jgi:hypothetical protein